MIKIMFVFWLVFMVTLLSIVMEMPPCQNKNCENVAEIYDSAVNLRLCHSCHRILTGKLK